MDPFAADLRPLPGGRSPQAFLAEAGGERSVVRVYARPDRRGDAGYEIDVALLTLLRGVVPVPEVLELRRPVGDMPALLVTTHLPGVRLDDLLPGLDDDQLATVGAGVGEVLARLAGVPMLRAGEYADGELRIVAFPPGESTPGRAVLVHGDLSAGKLLVDPETLEVTGLVDFEAAHAGAPDADLETVLAWAPDACAQAVLATYQQTWS